MALFVLIASLFTAEGPLELSGWTRYHDSPNDRMSVRNGVLTCEFSPGPAANSGMGYSCTVPYYECGELNYEIMPRKTSTGSTSDFYMPIRIGTFYLFLQHDGMCRYRDSPDPKYFTVGTTKFKPREWTRVKIVWDNARRVVKYYVGDMANPDKVEYDTVLGAGYGSVEPGRMQVVIYNYARAAVTETHCIRDFEVRAHVRKAAKATPRTKALVFRGLVSEFFPLGEWTRGFADTDVVRFNLDYPGRSNTTRNANALSAMPDDETVAAAKLIVLCDIPLRSDVLPRPVQEDILAAVRDGARLLVTAGYAGLEKGEGYDSPIARALPVKLTSPWKPPVGPGEKKVCAYGRGKIAVLGLPSALSLHADKKQKEI